MNPSTISVNQVVHLTTKNTVSLMNMERKKYIIHIISLSGLNNFINELVQGWKPEATILFGQSRVVNPEVGGVPCVLE